MSLDEIFQKLTSVHLTQVQSRIWDLGGGPEGKIIMAFYSGATPEQQLSKGEVSAMVKYLLAYTGDDAKEANRLIELEQAKRRD